MKLARSSTVSAASACMNLIIRFKRLRSETPDSSIDIGMAGGLLTTLAIWAAVTTPIAIRFSPNRPPSLI